MKGDFSRRTFDPAERYSAVLSEQGRMLTDADLEEEHRILTHRIETETVDVIGGCGGPIGNAGFTITQGGTSFQIGAGRYYVDGIPVENDAVVDFTAQTNLPGLVWPPAGEATHYAVYLDVWRRLRTALDDPSIREVALGGPTTAAREQTVWQVRLGPVDDGATCASPLPDLGETTGTLAAQANPEAPTTEPCEVPPSAGFKGLENQLYRVEVHSSGDAYDLSAAPDVLVVTGFPASTTNQVTLASVVGLAVGDAVELYRSSAGSNRLKATFAHVTAIAGATVTLNTDVASFALADAPRLRKAAATFVWSRDNGSVVTAIERIDGAEITVRDLGPDEVLGFAPGQWVEVGDDRNELEMRPGQLHRIVSVDPARQVVVLATPAQQLATPADGSGIDAERHPKLRRWDGAGAIRFNNTAPGDDWIHLEDGVQVRFTTGQYRTGDYWFFPARTATTDPASGNIEWPHDAAGEPMLLAPHGVAHHYCRLALIELGDGDGEPNVVGVTNCRNLFPPVTELTNLLYVGGDGQEGLPDPADPNSRSVALGAPLQVRVTNGSHPVEGASVQFQIPNTSNGRLQNTANKTLPVVTDADGIATCIWHLDGTHVVQECQARLLNAAGTMLSHQAVNFHASLSVAARVAYDPQKCPELAGQKTVQDAIDALCQRSGGGRCCCIVIGPGGDYPDIETAIKALVGARERSVRDVRPVRGVRAAPGTRDTGTRDICLCLLPGDHQLAEFDLTSNEPARAWHLSIGGCGPATRLNVRGNLRVTGLDGFTLRHLDVDVVPGASIHATQCREVVVDGCRVAGFPDTAQAGPRRGLVRIHFASRIYVGRSSFESFQTPMLQRALTFFDGLGEFQELYRVQSWREFEVATRRLAVAQAARNQRERAALARDLRARVERSSGALSQGEGAGYLRLSDAIGRQQIDPLVLFDHLVAIRLAVLRVAPGIALEIGELRPDERGLSFFGPRDGAAVIENNDIAGLVSFYGAGTPEREFDTMLLRRLAELLREPPPQLRGIDLSVHVKNNRLPRFIVAEAMIETIERIVIDGGEANNLFASFHCTDNVVEGATSQFVARHLQVTSNEFSLAAVAGKEPGASQEVRIVDAAADLSVYTGNLAASDSFGAQFNAQILNASRRAAEAANLEIAFI